MRLWIWSDLHLEYAPLPEPLVIPDADVCIVAGDLCRGPDNGVTWLAEAIAPSMPCIYVAGNHEFYKGGIREGIAAGREAAEKHPNVHFLEDDFVVIDGVRFIGATLWTDYRIEGHQRLAMAHARDRMNDYRAIAVQRKPWQRFIPEVAYRMHQASRTFIETALRADPIPTLVVTHHMPHAHSIPKRYKGDLLNAAYASDLTDAIRHGPPALWVHGHAHESCDYRLLGTRVVCNPRGYGNENKSFDPAMVVEI